MDNLNLNVIDYLLIAVFAFSILAGFGRGFVREMIALLTLIAAVIVAMVFASPMASTFTNMAGVQNAVNQASSTIGVNASQPVSYVALGISFGLLFAGTVLAGALIGFFVNMAFQTGILGVGNRILGALFGFARGFIFCMVIIFVVQLSPFGTATWWQQSQLVNSFQPAVTWLGNIVSPGLGNIKDRLNKTVDDVNSSIQNMTQ